jgi:hypothetical protein
MQRILCFGAVLALAGSGQLSGTCTVAIAAHDFGILAVDCIEAHRDGSQSAACKMRAANGMAVTLAGMVLDGNTGLDLATVAIDSAGGQAGGLRIRNLALNDARALVEVLRTRRRRSGLPAEREGDEDAGGAVGFGGYIA